MDYFKSPADLKEYSQLLEITHIALALPTIKLHPVTVGDTQIQGHSLWPLDPQRGTVLPTRPSTKASAGHGIHTKVGGHTNISDCQTFALTKSARLF